MKRHLVTVSLVYSNVARFEGYIANLLVCSKQLIRQQDTYLIVSNMTATYE